MFVKLDFLDDHVTQLKYYKYRLFTRTNEFNILQRGNRLFQQWCVDMHSKVLQWKLNYVRTKQTELRADLYKKLEDQIGAEDLDLQFTGKKVILPATCTFTPRWYDQKYRDAMAIISKYHKPDLFITFTCNPKWQEIQQELYPGQKAIDRPELCARVFQMKKEEMMKDLTKNNVFGRAVAWMHTIEFQKRGLPHAHILIVFDHETRLMTTEDFDRIVLAEIPDRNEDRELHDLVMEFMIHTPCDDVSNSPCKKDNGRTCQSHFPRDYQNYTLAHEDGFPKYKRRSPRRGGHTGRKRIRGRGLTKITNKWVVPYNPYLLRKYKAHINVEVCSSILAIKYLYKYIYKGHDKVSYAFKLKKAKNIKSRNEIKRYFDALYIAGAESCWKLHGFHMHSRSPAVIICKIHLPDQQLVYYHPDSDLQQIMNNEKTSRTMLTEWFANNQKEKTNPLPTEKLLTDAFGNSHPPGPQLYYHEYPEHYSWNTTSKRWTRRTRRDPTIGRMHRLSPKCGEVYYLRLLLLNVKGATDWKDLLTPEDSNQPLDTFKKAATARGLLKDDIEWNRAMVDASKIATGHQLSSLFVTILTNCEVANALLLFNNHKQQMQQDILYRLKQTSENKSDEELEMQAENYLLIRIEDALKIQKKTLEEFNLPKPDYNAINTNPEIELETQYDRDECKSIVTKNTKLMNVEQKAFYEAVMKSVDDDEAKIFFLDALGGTGKTFVAETILADIRSRGEIAMAVAFSGIAALLLPGGRTVHSRFNLPIKFDDTTIGDISQQSNAAEAIRLAKIIIWDEAPMAHRNVLECIDRTLRDLLHQDTPFGGKTIVLSGDFRQVLPVVRRAGRAQIVQSCINRSHLWQYVETHHLKTNERVKRNANKSNRKRLKAFADMLEKIGDGKYPVAEDLGSDMIQIPDPWLSKSVTLEQFIDEAFPDLHGQCTDQDYLKGRAILTPLNKDAQAINNEILKRLPGMDSRPILAVDENRTDTNFNYGEEVLNSIDPSGLPPYKLYLKRNAVIMVLRNVNPAEGLCNGTRLQVVSFTNHVIQAIILTGPKKGTTVFLPKIRLFADETSPVPFKRHQFPVKLAFAMTINKAQGQTLDFMALYLPKPVFAHGQLYVACGRVGSEEKLTIFIEPGESQGMFKGHEGVYTRNVVYQEVFDDSYSYVDFEDEDRDDEAEYDEHELDVDEHESDEISVGDWDVSEESEHSSSESEMINMSPDPFAYQPSDHECDSNDEQKQNQHSKSKNKTSDKREMDADSDSD